MKLVIRGGRVVDPSQALDEVADIVIEDGRVRCVGETGGKAGKVIHAKGLIVAPGFIDMHAHLREPGMASAECVATGAEAAVRGGFSSICAMPNTSPPLDSGALVRFVQERGREAGFANVFVAGALSAGMKGEGPSSAVAMKHAGAVALSDDGATIADARSLLVCMQYATLARLPVILHCEDVSLVAGGSANEGAVASRLGLAGRPPAAEDISVYRALRLAELAGCRLHVAHVSTARAAALVAEWKRLERLTHLSAEVTPHHLVLTDEELAKFDTRFKLYPPLRARVDVDAVRSALASGEIDAVATDHAPHPPEEKELEFDRAAPGVVGLETAIGVVMTELVRPGHVELHRMVDAFSCAPARILRLEGRGTLVKDSVADVTLFDPEMEWEVKSSKFCSRGRSTPFEGRTLVGRAVCTIVGGKVFDLGRKEL